ncbi:MAG: preprotein translocase subunit SecE [Pseudomonadota bacterium]
MSSPVDSSESLPKQFLTFSKKAWGEIYKIEWPQRDEVTRQVLFLAVVIAILSLFFTATDFAIFKIIHYFFSLFQR